MVQAKKYVIHCCILMLLTFASSVYGAMTKKQLQAAMASLRVACESKHKSLTAELIDGLKTGQFVDDKDLKCYTLCIGQMGGILNKKGDLVYAKALSQIDVMIPEELKQRASESLEACKHHGSSILTNLKGRRIVQRTRGLMTRFFEAICNTGIPTPGAQPRSSSAPPAHNINK